MHSRHICAELLSIVIHSICNLHDCLSLLTQAGECSCAREGICMLTSSEDLLAAALSEGPTVSMLAWAVTAALGKACIGRMKLALMLLGRGKL